MGKGIRIKVTAIVPSAGMGKRFKSKVKKAFAALRGKPLLLYALNTLQSSTLIKDIIVVIDGASVMAASALVRRYRLTKVRHIIEGGKTRSDSVRKGLNCVDSDVSFILIHDGVRPFLCKDIIRKTIAGAIRFGASISAVPVKATIKVAGKGAMVMSTPSRKVLWEVHTPQVFKKNLIDTAYKKIKGGSFTDDAARVEKLGAKVKIVRGNYGNIKITTIEDIRIAGALLSNRYKAHDKDWHRLRFSSVCGRKASYARRR